MTVSTDVQLFGVRDALAELRSIDPKMRTAAVREVKRDLSGLLEPARATYPASTGLRGWSRGTRGGRLGYDGAKVKQGVQVVVGGRTPKGANRYPIVTIVQKNAGGALFSLAGMENGAQSVRGKRDRLGRPYTAAQSIAFLNKIAAENGKAQRGLWQARTEIRDAAGESIGIALEKVTKQVNRRIVPQTPEVKSAIRGYRFDITKPDAAGVWY